MDITVDDIALRVGADAPTVAEHVSIGRRACKIRLPHRGMDRVEAKMNGTPRGGYAGYVHRSLRGELFVAFPEADFLRKSHFQGVPLYERCVQTLRELLDGQRYVPADICCYDLASVRDLKLPDTVAFDTEGFNKIFRYSLAWREDEFVWGASLPWDNASKAWLESVFKQAHKVITWHGRHDTDLLTSEGVYLEPAKHIDAMILHQLLNPWQRRALGIAAPLYGMFMPWKGKAKEDAEEYSLEDATATLRIYEDMCRQLREKRMERLADVELQFHRLLKFPAKPRWESDENHIVKAAGLWEGSA